MKKLSKYFAIAIMFIAVGTSLYSCNNDDDDPVASPYAGTWSGTYDGDDTGTWILVISDGGTLVKGSGYSNSSQQTVGSASFYVTADGVGKGVDSSGILSFSQFTGNKVTGTWRFPNRSASGTLTGSRDD